MNYYSGKDGALTYGGMAIAKISNWSISATVDALETTVLSENDRTYVPGLRTISGSATIFYYEVAGVASSPNKLLGNIIKKDAVTESDRVEIILHWGGKRIRGNCVITSAELSCAVGEVMQASIQFQFNGPPDEVTL
jgi:hypothetical protein